MDRHYIPINIKAGMTGFFLDFDVTPSEVLKKQGKAIN